MSNTCLFCHLDTARSHEWWCPLKDYFYFYNTTFKHISATENIVCYIKPVITTFTVGLQLIK